MLDNIFVLHANCIPVKGFKRSGIVDLQRGIIKLIPNSMYELISSGKINVQNELNNFFEKEDKEIFLCYLNFLVDNDLGFYTSNTTMLKYFPELSMEWDYPAIVSNAIIDISIESYNLEEVVLQLNKLGCYFISIRIFSSITYDQLICKLLSIKVGEIISLEIFLMWNYSFSSAKLKSLLQKFSWVKSVFIYNSPKQLSTEITNDTFGQIIFIKNSLFSKLQCGFIHESYFGINIPLFTEAQQHNTCLNRKISIDVNGEIKNCPSMAKSYGNIKDTTLAEAIEKPGFKDLWFINKDKIHVCKDCEFRYICTDCRAYIENPEDIYSKPLKCGYNPYTAEWEEWSTNPLKQKAIEYYGMQELVKKEK
ncbi:MAG: grasp-with-spasm system SPASM domain peptide maturase [Bacteroidetes bacterium]|nr:grasp-with-spasm system SPASM domain peptide maturase [Bacteroidota bacterium]